MYYNKTIFTEDDAKSLDTMLSKAKVAFPITNSWYFQAFYAATGGVFCGANGDDEAAGIVLGDNATATTKYLLGLAKNPNFVKDDAGSGLAGLKDGSIGAIFSGTWDYQNVVDAIGAENVGICQLPTINVDGKDYALKAFGGSKAVGVNKNSKQMQVSVALAQYLASEDAQKAHYEMRNIVPCNTKLLASDAVKNDALAQAQANTMANTAIIQPNNKTFGDNWWNNATTMANAIMDGTVTEANAADETAKFENAINGR
jgi:arabinogalactan oligomer/maltooligosaccharide transport system substrate-binding protein